MKPFILGVQSYPLMVFIGMLLFLAISFVRLKDLVTGKWQRLFFLCTIVWVSAIGARILYHYHFPEDSLTLREMIFPFMRNGFAVYGGLIGGALGVWILSMLKHQSFLKWMDQLMPGIFVGLAVGRIGCFLGGCCYGKVWNGPWAVHFPYGSEPHKWQLMHQLVEVFDKPLGIHPTQLYECVSLICLTLWIYYLEHKKKLREGQFFFLGLGGYSLFRMINLMFRAEPSGHLPGAFYLILYGFLINVAILGVAIGVIRNETDGNI